MRHPIDQNIRACKSGKYMFLTIVPLKNKVAMTSVVNLERY